MAACVLSPTLIRLQGKVRKLAKLGMDSANKAMDATVGGVGRLIIHGEVGCGPYALVCSGFWCMEVLQLHAA